ncbi:MAG: hypothetical protein ACREX9_13480 [Gammaproteobacteria bacterium]
MPPWPWPRNTTSPKKKDIVAQGAMRSDWSPAKRRQKDLDASWSKKHGKSHYGYKLTVVYKPYNLIRRLETVMPPPHDSKRFDAGLDQTNTSRGRSMLVKAMPAKSERKRRGFF